MTQSNNQSTSIGAQAKHVIRLFCPPILLDSTRRFRHALLGARETSGSGTAQDLGVYWDPQMAEHLDAWGEGNVWNEIQLLMTHRTGKVLDIACGTGKVMEMLQPLTELEIHGFDISDLLIEKALKRGIPPDRVKVSDGTAMDYAADSFDFAYSIGSLEHFTEDGIGKFIKECARVVNGPTFHMVPISRKGMDEGWIKKNQSYHNNSEAWWRAKCCVAYSRVTILGSSWSDQISVGRWIVCENPL